MKRRDFCRMSLISGAAMAVPASRLIAASEASSQLRPTDLLAVKLSGAETTIEGAAVRELRASLSGSLLAPGDEDYEPARRIWNGMIDKHPALIARCADVTDVVRAVTFARERELLLAVRGGGHSFPGYSTCDGGLVIDLSPMRSVVVDTDARTARVAAGAWGAHVDVAAQKQGLATTVGKVRRVSERDEPDLFWALRGGGGNFGVATSFEYRLHPLNPTVVAGHLEFPRAQIRDSIEFYAKLMSSSPRELSADLGLSPYENGKFAARIYVVYSGDDRSAGKVLGPLQRFGKPVNNTIRQQSYLVMQTQFDTAPVDPTHYYLKGGFVREYSSGLMGLLADEFRADEETQIYCQNANGAVADVPQTAAAFSHRNAIVNMMLLGFWKERSQDEAHRGAMRATWSKLAPFTEGYYVNLNDADPKGTDSNYGPNFTRLATLKKKFDPMNLFRLNANIKPA